MDDLIDINIEIENRNYSISIPKKDEEHWRLTGKKIRERIIYYRREQKVQAIQDILTNVALEAMSAYFIEKAAAQELKNGVIVRLNRLNNILPEDQTPEF